MTSCRNISNLRICVQLLIQEFAATEKYVPFVVLVLVEDVSHREVDKGDIFISSSYTSESTICFFVGILLWMKYKIGIKRYWYMLFLCKIYYSHAKK